MTLPRTLELIAEASCQSRSWCSVISIRSALWHERFLHDAADLGIAGLLLTDLPPAAIPAWNRRCARALWRSSAGRPHHHRSPTPRGGRGAEGFLYLVARLGVTGASANLASGIEEYVARVRAASPLPLAVGFGISTHDQAARIAGLATGWW